MEKLSIIVPAYNEEKTLAEIINKVLGVDLPDGFQKEILIINDCSKDNTKAIAEELSRKFNEIKVISNEVNLGKSQTVKKGILNSTGDFVVIQDADLEYEPSDFAEMLKVLKSQNYDVVYGNRFGRNNKVIYWLNYVGNRAISAFSNIFTYPRNRTWIPDMETCYKLVRGEVIRDIAQTLSAKSNFGFEPEVTAKLSKYKLNNKRLKFGIFPISYYPRSVAEGKKIKAIEDGYKALKEIIYYNLFA